MQLIVSVGFLLVDVCGASDQNENFRYVVWIQLTLQIMRIAGTITKSYSLVRNILFSVTIIDLMGNSGRVNVLIVQLTKESILGKETIKLV